VAVTDVLVLHIGTHKTGTSSIQGSLAASADRLLEDGILYPRAGRLRTRPQHANLAWEALGESGGPVALGQRGFDTAQGGTEDLLAEVAAVDPRVVIVSSEAFMADPLRYEPTDWALRLCERLGVSEVLVLGYARPQWQYIESSYPYRVWRGLESRDFPAFAERALKSPLLDYSVAFGPWLDAFGDALSVRPYAGGRPRDAVEDFWHAIDWLPDRPIARVSDENLRPGARTTGMLVGLRRALAERGLDEPRPLAAGFKHARRTLRSAREDQPFRGLSPEIAARTHGHFLESNRWVVDRFGEAHSGLLATPEVTAEPIVWSLADATAEERVLFERLVHGAIDAASDGLGQPAREGPATARADRRAHSRGRRLLRAARQRMSPGRGDG
jgi:hypothetical protein